MPRPGKLEPAALETWLAAHPGWAREGDALVRSYRFGDFAAALAFTVRLGMIAEKKDHHPDIHLGWGKARVLWTTHDAGGITALDLALAEATDGISPS
jgi:4a-hydroxytetrahydrobiopterin dehydratase